MSQNPYEQPSRRPGQAPAQAQQAPPPQPQEQPFPPQQAPSQPPQPQQGPYVPPPVPGQYGYAAPPAQRSTWPTVIGIISIVFGSLGLICTPISLAAIWHNPNQQQAMRLFPPWVQTYQFVSMALGVALAVFLLIAGILCVKRHPATRALHLSYAAAGILMAVVGGAVMLSALNLNNAPAPVVGGAIGGALGGFCGGSAYPIFLLVWFLRGRIRNEVAGWR